LFFVESALLHGFLVARKPSSQDSTGPKIPRQVNTKERTIFVEEESELLRFLKAGYGVRCGSLDGGPCNIYSINSRSIARAEGLEKDAA